MNKKSQTKSKISGEPENISRRNFLQGSLKALTALAAIELGAAGLLFLRARSLDGEYGGIMTVGKVEDFTPGSVVEYEDGNFFLVRVEDGGFMAVYRRCPHLGCTVQWVAKKQKFFCPCHAASFDPYGEFENQPVARALDTFKVFFEDDMVKVDTSQMRTREHHSAQDISYQS